MQRIALGWFVLQLTHSAFAVGVMAVAQFLPFTLFGLFAGVLTDRLDARRLVIGTQIAQLATAIALAWIALAQLAQPWMLYTIAFLNGLVLVLDVPSRQQLTYRMVGRDELPNAIALNSSLFNASRIFGPATRRHRLRLRRRGRLLPRQRAQLPRRAARRCSRCARASSSRSRSSSGPPILRGTLEGLALRAARSRA